ncbi:shieldin complex subunit 3 [Pempheris klunzingeri]|uniref:shieldin complex subunit 3 n=1 Tax=Pempheris klunzingeri TaxID=3127111 RepID=UPI00397FD460
MEDVVLHYHPGSAAGLGALLETTEKLLESFPCRTPPVFTPWFPTEAARHLPIRPAKPAPVITSADLPVSGSGPHAHTAQNKQSKLDVDGFVVERRHDHPHAETSRTAPEHLPKLEDGVYVSETPNHLLPSSLFNRPEGEIAKLRPGKHKDGLSATDSPVKRSWSVFTQKGVQLQTSQTLSKQFHHMVSTHRLHLRQRAKWMISQHNCGASRDIEQVWRTLSRSVRSSRLPSCNANIQRERAEIWVFCDVLHAEQVGRFLKDELQLSGRIGLSVHKLGNVFSM